MSDRRRTLGAGDEIRDARQDADVRLGPDRLQRGREDLHPAAWDHLACLQTWARTQRVLVDVTTDVRITQERKSMYDRHPDELPELVFLIDC